MLKLLWRDNLTPGTTQFQIPPGRYSSFFVVYQGVNGAGNTITLLNLGQTQLNWGGDDKVNVDTEFLSQASNLYGGTPQFASAIGAAFNAAIIIPCSWWYDPKNIYNVVSKNDAFMKFDYTALPALIASGTISIYGVPKAGYHSYFHKILSYNIVSGGAGTLTNYIPQPNIIELYLKNPTALINQIQVSKDGRQLEDSDSTACLYYSNWIHQLETASTLLALEFAPSLDIREAYASQLTWQYVFTGAGTQSQYYSSIELTPNLQKASMS